MGREGVVWHGEKRGGGVAWWEKRGWCGMMGREGVVWHDGKREGVVWHDGKTWGGVA